MRVWVVGTHTRTRLPDRYMMLLIYVPAGTNIILYPSPYRVKPVRYSSFGYPLPSLVIIREKDITTLHGGRVSPFIVPAVHFYIPKTPSHIWHLLILQQGGNLCYSEVGTSSENVEKHLLTYFDFPDHPGNPAFIPQNLFSFVPRKLFPGIHLILNDSLVRRRDFPIPIEIAHVITSKIT
jgi:hypothetical protein